MLIDAPFMFSDIACRVALSPLIQSLASLGSAASRAVQLSKRFENYRLLSLREHRIWFSALSHSTPRYFPSLPLDRAGCFQGHVVDDPVDAAHLVDNARAGACQEFVR